MYIPANIIVVRPHAEAKLALRLNTSNQSQEEVFAREWSLPIGYRQKRAGDGSSGMDELVQVSVVIVENVR